MPVYDLTSENGLLLDRRFRARSKKRLLVLGGNGRLFNVEYVNVKYPYFYRTKRTIDSALTNLSMCSFSLSMLSHYRQPLGGAFRLFDSLFKCFLLLMRDNYTLKKTQH